MDDRRRAAVKVVQNIQQPEREVVDLLLPEHGAGVHALFQRTPLDELLYDVVRRRVALPLEIVEDPRDAGMLEHGEYLRLPLEQLQELPVAEAGEVQFLDRNPSILQPIEAEERARGRSLAEHTN